ncbi:MAG: BolA/IbaG family iron-sulfur metabolism protein [Proteobacteria bacterium]|nr:BolA/IbaG family iron-sulfur metabolism protein [Pseudomonadota bacterium]
MSITSVIETKLAEGLNLDHLEVVNESGNHNVPAGSESHFKVVLVTAEFTGQRLLQRHRRVNELLATELADHIHALAIHTFTPHEWQARFGQAPMSPPCMGGSAAGESTAGAT